VDVINEWLLRQTGFPSVDNSTGLYACISSESWRWHQL